MTTGRFAPSNRAAGVQLPIIPIVAGWIAETPGTISLGQGVVHYGPPPAALAAIPEFLATVPHHQYIPDAGLPELRKAFEGKLRDENGIDAPFERRIYVTVGANQAFLNAVLAICDPGDEVILLSPYYFNHEMAITLASAVPVPVPVDERLQPDLPAIAAAITERTRAIVTVSPNNPTGAVYPRETLAAIHRLCAERGIYHVSDEAYEYFTYDGARHFSPGSLGGEHAISLYSLSKAYGMASWRVGFLVAPEHLHRDLMKIQDTVVVSGAGDLPVRGAARDARRARILRGAPPFPREGAERGPCAARSRSGPGGGPPRDGSLLPVREGEHRDERHRPVGTARAGAQGGRHPRGDVRRDGGGAGCGSPTEACGRRPPWKGSTG